MSMIKGAEGAKGAQTRGKLGQTQCDCTAHGTDVRNVMSTPPHSQRLHQLQSVSARLQALTLGCLDTLHARGLAAICVRALVQTEQILQYVVQILVQILSVRANKLGSSSSRLLIII